ncbi:hypothetical protein BDW72DRAFT_170438 [Aspergillus terricola var. indicus]
MSGDEEPPLEVHHYENRGQVPWDIQNYWSQRYDLFSKYDDGIWLTDDAWFGVTPEPVATKIAEQVARASPPERKILVDVFAGAGGNTIAFARSGHWKRVYAIEKDPATLRCAQHNAEVYGVADKITWFQGNCFDVLKSQLRDLAPYSVLFASPPWGGPGYRSESVFDLRTMEPYSLNILYTEFSLFTQYVILYLPRTSDLNQLAAMVKNDGPVPVMHYCMRGASKALCIFYGGFRLS